MSVLPSLLMSAVATTRQSPSPAVDDGNDTSIGIQTSDTVFHNYHDSKRESVQGEGMAGVKLKLGMPEVAVRAVAMHAKQPHGWRKTWLLAVKLAGSGEWTSEEVAEGCGVSRGRVFVWLKTVRERGLEVLLERGNPGLRAGVCRGV